MKSLWGKLGGLSLASRTWITTLLVDFRAGSPLSETATCQQAQGVGDRALRCDLERDQPASILVGNDSARGFCVGLHFISTFSKALLLSAGQSLVALAGTVQGLSMHRGMSVQGSCSQLLWAVGQAGHCNGLARYQPSSPCPACACSQHVALHREMCYSPSP